MKSEIIPEDVCGERRSIIFILNLKTSIRINHPRLYKILYNLYLPYKKWKWNRNCYFWDLDYLLKQGMTSCHPIGIVMTHSKVGRNCAIFQNVTIGAKNNAVPELGDNVTVFPNSVIVGNVRIGNNSVIGAGSIVLKDVPANEVWAGNPARFIKKVDTTKSQKANSEGGE